MQVIMSLIKNGSLKTFTLGDKPTKKTYKTTSKEEINMCLNCKKAVCKGQCKYEH